MLASLDSVLAEPIAGVIATDAAGRPCIETKTTLDLEEALRMPGGNIFHGPLSWPWAEPGASLSTPAERWGVATAHPRHPALRFGCGARRSGQRHRRPQRGDGGARGIPAPEVSAAAMP